MVLSDANPFPQGSHRPGKVLELDLGPGKLLLKSEVGLVFYSIQFVFITGVRIKKRSAPFHFDASG